MTHTPEQLASMTPAEVDTVLAPLEYALGEIAARAAHAAREAREAARMSKAPGDYYSRRAERAEAHQAEEEAKKPAALAAVEPYRAEYDRRPWPRVFWCTASGGHAHRSLSCHTLHIGTRMVWLPEESGKTEAELVEMAGESACTVCYPSAPATPSQLRPAREARETKEARQREAAERKAAKDAKGITAPDGSPLKVDRWEIKTETTARNEYVKAAAEAADLADGLGYCAPERRPELAAKYARHAAQLVEALAHKHGRTVAEEVADLAPKVAARRAKDARERAKYAS